MAVLFHHQPWDDWLKDFGGLIPPPRTINISAGFITTKQCQQIWTTMPTTKLPNGVHKDASIYTFMRKNVNCTLKSMRERTEVDVREEDATPAEWQH